MAPAPGRRIFQENARWPSVTESTPRPAPRRFACWSAETWDDWCPQFAERIPEVCEGYWQKAFARVRPTAVVVFDDALLLSLYSYCSFRKWTIPDDLTVVLLNYDELFEWLRPRPTMMRYPLKAAASHFRQWVDGGLKPLGLKYFELELIEGASVGPPRRQQ